MKLSDPRLAQFIPTNPPPYPLPWHNHNFVEGRPHLVTEKYVRYLLDVLAGDERRGELRRAYRFFMLNDTPYSNYRTVSRWILIVAVNKFMYVLPPQRVNEYLDRQGKRG